MTRKFSWLVALMLAVPVWAADSPGAISGTVRNSSGVGQMAARVEFFAGSLVPAATVFTDAAGFFRATNLSPGIYDVKISAPSFLPVLDSNLSIKAGADLVLNITLNTLFEAVQAIPVRRRGAQDQEDWKWILRSTASRSILRVLDDKASVSASPAAAAGRPVNGELAFLAGSDAGALGGSYDMATAFTMERSLFNMGTLVVGGNVGYGVGAVAPGSELRVSYSHPISGGSQPQIAFTLQRLAGSETVDREVALQAASVEASDSLSLDEVLDLKFGGEFQTVQFAGVLSALSPFGAVDLHLSPNTMLEYRYTTSVPNVQPATDLDASAAELSDPAPRISLANSYAVLERDRHNEVSLIRHFGGNHVQVAWYRDRISDPALTGVGFVAGDSGDLMQDTYSGTFAWNGPELVTSGMRAVIQRPLTSGLTATLDYSYGGVLALAAPEVSWQDLRPAITTQERHSVTCKLSGTVPQSHTRWQASYQWINGEYALTRVDMFDASVGQADPYLSIFVRQPIPGTNFMPVHMEALVDIRNLLAQGYVPVTGNAGHNLYLAESARVFRGGVAFTF